MPAHLAYDEQLIYFEDALAHQERGDFARALISWDAALAIGESAHVRWNRGQALLSLGRYPEGFADFASRWALTPNLVAAEGRTMLNTIPRWMGQDLAGKRLVVMHEQGYGDTILMLRFVPMLQAMGAEVVLALPKVLHRLARQLAPVEIISEGDYVVPTFDLPHLLKITADRIPSAPYLKPDPDLVAAWKKRLPDVGDVPRVGIAWQAGSHMARDYKRSIPLIAFLTLLPAGCNETVFALQPNDPEEARTCGLIVHPFEDMADVAALASLMDVVICADVAAINVAGAIGHARAFVVLPWLSSWKWLGASSWYPRVFRCQQDRPDDWPSAFAKVTQALA